jgi:hypothetical protein
MSLISIRRLAIMAAMLPGLTALAQGAPPRRAPIAVQAMKAVVRTDYIGETEKNLQLFRADLNRCRQQVKEGLGLGQHWSRTILAGDISKMHLRLDAISRAVNDPQGVYRTLKVEPEVDISQRVGERVQTLTEAVRKLASTADPRIAQGVLDEVTKALIALERSNAAVDQLRKLDELEREMQSLTAGLKQTESIFRSGPADQKTQHALAMRTGMGKVQTQLSALQAASGKMNLPQARKYSRGLSSHVQSVRLSGDQLSAAIRQVEADQETVRNQRQMASTAFQNFDQKANQLYNMLSSVMKAMNEMRMGTVRNML